MPFCGEMRSRGVVFVTLFMISSFPCGALPAADRMSWLRSRESLTVIGPVTMRTSGRACGDSEWVSPSLLEMFPRGSVQDQYYGLHGRLGHQDQPGRHNRRVASFTAATQKCHDSEIRRR